MLEPQNCEPVDASFYDGDMTDWVVEPKWDGIRILSGVFSSDVQMWARSGNSKTGRVPYIEEELLNYVPSGTLLDGEVVSLHMENGVVSHEWNNAQSVMGSNKAHSPSASSPALTYVVFDILVASGDDVDDKPWTYRRELLEMLDLSQCERVTLTPYFDASLENHEKLLDLGFEGSVAKRTTMRYYRGARGMGWNKCKPQLDEDALVIGFYDPTAGSKYEGVAVGGIRFRTSWGYEGRAAGMDDSIRKDMYQRPDAYIGAVVELAHHGRQKSGALRHPQFKRMRYDKKW
jgi:bifunctional non-homologous end joining protein LigD